MHVIFTDEEKRWIDRSSWGWLIKAGCPENIRKAIERKKQMIAKQKIGGVEHRRD